MIIEWRKSGSCFYYCCCNDTLKEAGNILNCLRRNDRNFVHPNLNWESSFDCAVHCELCNFFFGNRTCNECHIYVTINCLDAQAWINVYKKVPKADGFARCSQTHPTRQVLTIFHSFSVAYNATHTPSIVRKKNEKKSQHN